MKSGAVGDLAFRYFNTSFVHGSLVQITTHVNVAVGVILNEVGIAVCGVHASRVFFRGTEPVERAHRLWRTRFLLDWAVVAH